MSKHPAVHTSRRRLTMPVVGAGILGSLAVVASMGVSLSGLTASIANSTNTSASATMAVQETSGAATCYSYDSTSTCDSINKYGGTTTPLAPGGSKTTTVTFKNTGQVAVATSTLAPSTCVASTTGATGSTVPTTPNTTTGNLCSVLQVQVYKGADNTTTPLYTGPLSGFTSSVSLGSLAVNASQPYTFIISLPATATNATQGQTVSQPLAWTFNQ